MAFTGDLDRIFEVTESVLKVERRLLFLRFAPPLTVAYAHVVLSGARAHTSAWNDVTVKTPMRLRIAFVCLLT